MTDPEDVPGAFSATGVDDPVDDSEYGDDDVQPDVDPSEAYEDDLVIEELAERGREYVIFELLGRDDPGFLCVSDLVEYDDIDVDGDDSIAERVDELVRRVDNFGGLPDPETSDRDLEAKYGDVADAIVDRWGSDS